MVQIEEKVDNNEIQERLITLLTDGSCPPVDYFLESLEKPKCLVEVRTLLPASYWDPH